MQLFDRHNSHQTAATRTIHEFSRRPRIHIASLLIELAARIHPTTSTAIFVTPPHLEQLPIDEELATYRLGEHPQLSPLTRHRQQDTTMT
jgi:hypothetical protein